MEKSTAAKVNVATIIFYTIMVFIFSFFLKASPVKYLLMLVMLSISGLSLVQVMLYKMRTSSRATVLINVLLVTIFGIALYFSILYLHKH